MKDTTMTGQWMTQPRWLVSHYIRDDRRQTDNSGRAFVRFACGLLVKLDDELQPEPTGSPIAVDLMSRCWRCERHQRPITITGNAPGDTYTVNAPPGNEREQQRMRLLPAVAKLARSPEFRAATGTEAYLIPVLPDDTVTYVLDRLAEAECPTVLVLPGDEGMRVVKLTEVTL